MAVPNSTITLSCCGGNITVERQVAEHSIRIQRMLEDLDDFSKPIEIGIGESVMKKVLEWCTHHRHDPHPSNTASTTEISEWDKNFMQIDQTFAFLIILAADHLEINGLLDLACKTVGKSPQEVGRYAVTHQRCYYP
jgi:S-phase kinase-associated protein 1